jgi:antibiotic biosynthesis monooxygenase (ABM) superfamily enzyme
MPPQNTETATARSAVAPAPPSIHVRALITWIAIFPLVTLGMFAIAPFSAEWNPVLRAFVLTLVVVPVAVYLVVPQLMRAYGALVRSRKR